jgi:hypothetical protein
MMEHGDTRRMAYGMSHVRAASSCARIMCDVRVRDVAGVGVGILEYENESVRAKQTHCGAKFRFEPAATTCAKASRQVAEGHILSTWRHTKFPDRSRLVHTAASCRHPVARR